jgi:hypothetical protein
VQGIVKPVLDLGIGDFQLVLDHLKEDGYFEGELIEPPSLKKGRRSPVEC